VEGATYYQIYIFKCAASGVCTRFQDINTQDTTYTTRLSNSAPDQYYDFDITAFMGSSLIGSSLTTFKGGYGSYRFQVETPLPSTIPAVPLLLLED
jgi:hypothetical protein